jgi:hypothetical protein
MENTRENFEYLSNKLLLQKYILISKYGKHLNDKQKESLEKYLNKKIMLYMPKYKESKDKSVAEVFYPILERACNEFLNQLKLESNVFRG